MHSLLLVGNPTPGDNEAIRFCRRHAAAEQMEKSLKNVYFNIMQASTRNQRDILFGSVCDGLRAAGQLSPLRAAGELR
jgi:hypothetical protein